MTTFTIAPKIQKQRIRAAKKCATQRFAMHGLTENGMTVAEEREILRRVEAIRNGTEKTIPAEEVWRRLGLED